MSVALLRHSSHVKPPSTRVNCYWSFYIYGHKYSSTSWNLYSTIHTDFLYFTLAWHCSIALSLLYFCNGLNVVQLSSAISRRIACQWYFSKVCKKRITWIDQLVSPRIIFPIRNWFKGGKALRFPLIASSIKIHLEFALNSCYSRALHI